MIESTTLSLPDARDLDCVHLGRVAGADYYELRQILRVSGPERTIVGRASDWPIVSRDARIRELELLVTRATRHASEADGHVVDLIEERDALLARLTAAEQIPAAVAAAAVGLPLDTQGAAPDDGLIACDWPGCSDRVKPRGLGAHKKRAHGVAGSVGHKGAEPPWRCEACNTSTHTRSLSEPALCMRCAADKIATNGHQVVV